MRRMNPEVDAYVGRAEKWQGETRRLRAILLDCGLGEELKWGKPCYTFQGGNLAIIQGFKDHCSLMFFKGALLDDAHGVLVRPGESSRAQRRVEFTSVRRIDELEPIVRALVDQAKAVEKAGLKVDPGERRDLELPEELTAKLDESPELAAAFRALTPGRQRAYVHYFSGAKQAKTRAARIEKHVQRILAGKGLNDR